MKYQAVYKWQNTIILAMICLVVALAATQPAQPAQASPTTAAPIALVKAASYEATDERRCQIFIPSRLCYITRRPETLRQNFEPLH